MERWLTENAFKLSEKQFGYPARLELFVAPSAAAPRSQGLLFVAAFGADIGLLGAQYPTATLQASDVVKVSLYWQADRTPGRDYTVTVQLWDKNGRVVRQMDQYPVGGFRPTSGWDRGEVVRDNYALVLPRDVPAGVYRIVVGLYQWPSMERLPLNGPEGLRVSEPNLLLLGQVAVGVPPPPPLPYPILK